MCETGCAAEKQAIAKALTALLEYNQHKTEQLKIERPADVQDLLNPRKFKGSFTNLTVTYFDFPTWLFRFDGQNIRGFSVNINSYRYQRNKHIQDVDIILANFLGKDTGSALQNAIGAADHELSILPYFNFSKYPVMPWRPLGLNATAQRLGGPPKTPADAAIMYNPYMWGQNGRPGSAGYGGPGSDADEVLFHELIHGLRVMKGVDTDTGLKLDDNYDNEEEFIAIVVTNIYLAEKRKLALRGPHQGFATLPQPKLRGS